MKIMIVDDSSVVRTVVVQALHMAGYTDIVEAPDGLQALNTARTLGSAVGLFVLDVNMPNMDGLTLVEELRASGIKAPIVMLTTETDKAKMARAKESGASGWIVKPFDAQKFLDVVRLFVKA